MIRVAIIGAGIGREHLAGYRALPDQFEVGLICDRDESRAAEIAGGLPISSDLSSVLADPAIDLIDICLPPHLHVSTVLAGLEAGKHVICEKPLAMSLADVDAIEAAMNQSGKQVFPVFQYRYGHGLACLSALIEAGLTGQPQVASLETHWNRGADYYAVPWRGTWAGEQGGAILCHAIHAHDLLCHFFGPVRSVAAMLATRVNPIETEDCASLALTLTNGALASSSVTLGAADDRSRLRFVFENLTAESGIEPYAPGQGNWTFLARDPEKQAAIDQVVASVQPSPTGFAGFFNAVSYTLADQGKPVVSLTDGRRSVELVSAIYQSSKQSRVVSLPIAREDQEYSGWLPSDLR